MDDRRLDEKMSSYVRSTAKGEEHDLSRLKDREPPKKKKVWLKRLIPAFAAAVVVAVTLSLCLPPIFAEHDEESHYMTGDNGYHEMNVPLDDVSEIESTYGFAFTRPGIEVEFCNAAALIDKVSGEFCGAKLTFLPVDLAFDNVVLTVVPSGAKLDGLWKADTLYDTEFVWRGMRAHFTVKTEILTAEETGTTELECRTYRIMFVGEKDYYLTFKFYPAGLSCEVGMPDDEAGKASFILDLIFPAPAFS